MSNLFNDNFEKSADSTFNHPAANSGGFGGGNPAPTDTTTNAGNLARDNANKTGTQSFADEVDRSFGNDIRGEKAQVLSSYGGDGRQGAQGGVGGNTSNFSEGLKGDKDGIDGLGGGVGGYGDSRTDTYDSANQTGGLASGAALGAGVGYGAYQFGKDGQQASAGTGQEIEFGSQSGSNTSGFAARDESLLPNNFGQELKGDRDGRDALGGGVGGYGDSRIEKGDFQDSSRLDGLAGGVAAGVGTGAVGAGLSSHRGTDSNDQSGGDLNPKAFLQDNNISTGNSKVDNFAGDKLNEQYQQRTDKDGFTDLSTGEGSKGGLTGRVKLDKEDPKVETTKQRSETNSKGEELDSYGKPYTL